MEEHVFLPNSNNRQKLAEVQREYDLFILLFVTEELDQFHQHLPYFRIQRNKRFIFETAVVGDLVHHIVQLLKCLLVAHCLVVIVELSDES